MDVVKQIALSVDTSVENLVTLNIGKEEKLGNYLFYFERNHGISWPLEYCLYKNIESAEKAGCEFYQHALSAHKKWINYMNEKYGAILVRQIKLTDPRDVLGEILNLFYVKNLDAYKFTLGTDEEYFPKEFGNIGTAINVGREAYKSELNDDQDNDEHILEPYINAAYITFSFELYGYIGYLNSIEIEWISNIIRIRRFAINNEGINSICRKLSDLEYEIRKRGINKYIITSSTDIYLDPIKIDFAWKEISEVIGAVTQNKFKTQTNVLLD